MEVKHLLFALKMCSAVQLKVKQAWAVVGAQLVERSLPTPEILEWPILIKGETSLKCTELAKYKKVST